MSEMITGVFHDSDEALAAARELVDAGVRRSAIDIISAEPIHGADEFAGDPRPSRQGLFAVAGAIIGAAVGLSLAVWSSGKMGLITGGLPINSFWAFGIITFELGALAAILFTLIRMIWEARLARGHHLPDCDSILLTGGIALLVSCVGGLQTEEVCRILAAHRSEILKQ